MKKSRKIEELETELVIERNYKHNYDNSLKESGRLLLISVLVNLALLIKIVFFP